MVEFDHLELKYCHSRNMVGSDPGHTLDEQINTPVVSASTMKRLTAIDATRGTAMIAVFLSHFAFIYFHNDYGIYGFVPKLYIIAQIASPTFVLISGIMLGFLYETHK